tara:strand:- start:270 stop:449 length:180 start_codon:yes stop_codon:yes gene_type:complete
MPKSSPTADNSMQVAMNRTILRKVVKKKWNKERVDNVSPLDTSVLTRFRIWNVLSKKTD